MNKIDVESKEGLANLGFAITMEGLSEDSIPAFINWIKEYTPIKKEDVYITKGVTMNNELNLTGNNRYPDDLTIVRIHLEDVKIGNNKLYTYDLYNHSLQYRLLVITKWTDRTSEACEESHKAYYILKSSDSNIESKLTKESFLEEIFRLKEYSILK